MMIKLFNTDGRQKSVFTPLTVGEVRIYSCGPTVYDYPHIGNFRSYIFADTLHRLFAYENYKVKHLINITDVGHLTGDSDAGQDKVEEAAKQTGQTAQEITTKYTDIFLRDIKSLNLDPSEYLFPKASEHIPEQIDLITKLITKGLTYQTSDGIYFDTTTCPTYSQLAGSQPTDQSLNRIDPNPEKKNSRDFALWKFSKPSDQRQQEWPSPWGLGFPGWHLECSAMAMKYLGETFDIHTGGIDHIPVHHTNEKAQTESVTGQTMANFWLHNAFVTIDQAKMAKSENNFITLAEIEKMGLSPLALRYLFLGTHYRKNLGFSVTALSSAEIALNKLRHFIIESTTDQNPGSIIIDQQAKYREALADDLNTPLALAIAWETIDDPNQSLADKRATLFDLDQLLGLGLTKITSPKLTADIKTLITKREEARQAEDWPTADQYRDQLDQVGFIIKDTAAGPILLPKSFN